VNYKKRKPNLSKHSARIAAIQAMYQCEITGENINEILNNFKIHYIEVDEIHKDINMSFFNKLISHFSKNTDLTVIIEENLDESSVFSSLPLICRCILKVALLEMKFEKTDIPVVINEYVDISKYFLNEKTTSFVNAILDKISKNIERTNT
jgi:N utilization substance protein B